jgi:hypothetical protein
LFIPEPRAQYLAQVWHAMVTSKTWSDLKRLAPRRAYREIRKRNNDLEAAELRSNAPFDCRMAGVSDGDYPGWPAQEMLHWMPADIRQTFGSVQTSMLNGFCLVLEPEDEEAIVRRLQQAGFRSRRDQQLVERAHGD